MYSAYIHQSLMQSEYALVMSRSWTCHSGCSTYQKGWAGKFPCIHMCRLVTINSGRWTKMSSQIFTCYVHTFSRCPIEERARDLFISNRFICECEACTHRWPVYTNPTNPAIKFKTTKFVPLYLIFFFICISFLPAATAVCTILKLTLSAPEQP